MKSEEAEQDRHQYDRQFKLQETFYNRRRKHSCLGYLCPDELERCKTLQVA